MDEPTEISFLSLEDHLFCAIGTLVHNRNSKEHVFVQAWIHHEPSIRMELALHIHGSNYLHTEIVQNQADIAGLVPHKSDIFAGI